MQGDLAIAASRLQRMVEKDPRWFGFDDVTLLHWESQQGVLARELEPEPWELVSQSALELNGLTDGMRRTLGPGGPDEGKLALDLTPNQLAGLRTMWDNASQAHRALADLAGVEREEGLLHEGA